MINESEQDCLLENWTRDISMSEKNLEEHAMVPYPYFFATFLVI